uniref:Leucine carboxyl methyltransferase 1 n=1 Tax=Strigamia maritima TaxID=126957 RepID=T1JIF8_STRMM
MDLQSTSDDDAIQATNDDAASCKRCAVQLGYWHDPYLQYFVRASDRKTPEINRGYYARVQGIKQLIDQVIQVSNGNCQIINLGAGFDTLYWRLKDEGKSVKNFIEVDFPTVTSKKCHFIKKSKPLLQGITYGDISLNVTDLHAANYHIVGCDMRHLNSINQKLKDCDIDFSLTTIVIAECVLVYMDVDHSNNLLHWLADNFKIAVFINYEQVNMEDRFGQIMVDNLKKRGCSLAGVKHCKSLESQKQRFLHTGWQKSDAWLMTEVYHLIPQADLMRMEKIEFLDERELLEQLFQHYCICIACNDDKWIGYQYLTF